jgi:hypothetical protein
MARFLSGEWFDALAAADPHAELPGAPADLVIEQIVTGTPEGDVRYQIWIGAGQLRVVGPREVLDPEPAVTFTSDYTTMAAVASGRLSTNAALLEGRMRVGGRTTALAEQRSNLANIDLVPSAVRAATTYEPC